MIDKIYNTLGRICPERLRLFKIEHPQEWGNVVQYSLQHSGISDPERIYLFVHKCEPSYCRCGKKLKLRSFVRGYGEFCSIKCMANSTECIMKRKETKLKRHGDEHYNNREKFKDTNKERFGVEFPQQNREINQKRENTCVERFGGNSPACSLEVQDKIRVTKYIRHGDENYVNIEKHKRTCLERYGVENFSQSEQSREGKSSYRWKNFTFNTGETIRCQGYEPIELKRLETEGYSFSDITPQKRFRYFDTTQNKYRYYFADITIENEKRVIEVKSEYTLGRDRSIADKQLGVELAGYSFEVRVY